MKSPEGRYKTVQGGCLNTTRIQRLWLGECSAVLCDASRKGGRNWLNEIAQGKRLSCLSYGEKVETNEKSAKGRANRKDWLGLAEDGQRRCEIVFVVWRDEKGKESWRDCQKRSVTKQAYTTWPTVRTSLATGKQQIRKDARREEKKERKKKKNTSSVKEERQSGKRTATVAEKRKQRHRAGSGQKSSSEEAEANIEALYKRRTAHVC